MKAEIDEKAELMEKSIKDKDSGKENLQTQMTETLNQQAECLKKETESYKQAIDTKLKEEEELKNVQKQYKDRYSDFDKGVK